MKGCNKGIVFCRFSAVFFIKTYLNALRQGSGRICPSASGKFAVVAQLVEHLHGKEGVSGPIPDNGSERFTI